MTQGGAKRYPLRRVDPTRWLIDSPPPPDGLRGKALVVSGFGIPPAP